MFVCFPRAARFSPMSTFCLEILLGRKNQSIKCLISSVKATKNYTQYVHVTAELQEFRILNMKQIIFKRMRKVMLLCKV